MIPELGGDFLQKLRAFYYAIETGSINKAAKAMRRSQSTISQHIKMLEEELDSILIQRTAKGAIPTANGERLFTLAIEVFDRINVIKSQGSNEQHISGTVRMGLTPVPLLSYLPRYLRGMREKYPDVHFEIHQSIGISQLLKSIGTGEIDFCIATKSMVPQHLYYMPLYESQLVLVVPTDMKLKKNDIDNLEKLAALPHIALFAGASISKTIDDCFSKAEKIFAPEHLCSTFIMQLQMVEAGYGVAIMDDGVVNYLVSGTRLSNIKIIHLDKLLPQRHFGIIVRKNSYLTIQANKIIEYLLEHGKNPIYEMTSNRPAPPSSALA